MLGIESSCDDTGVAVVRASDGAILGHAIANQARSHPHHVAPHAAKPWLGCMRVDAYASLGLWHTLHHCHSTHVSGGTSGVPGTPGS